jgi:cobalt/nickel transport protein
MRKTLGFVLSGLLLSLLLAGVVSNVASAAPDGLDSASTRGCTVDASGEITGGTCIAQGARDHELGGSPFADYGASGAGTAVSGVLGVLLTFALAGGLFWVVRRRRPAED